MGNMSKKPLISETRLGLLLPNNVNITSFLHRRPFKIRCTVYTVHFVDCRYYIYNIISS